MKVYVITRGSYSNYEVLGVTLDEKKADIIAKALSTKYDRADVEVYDTDKFELIKEGDRLFRIICVVRTHEYTISDDEVYMMYSDDIGIVETRYWHNDKCLVVIVAAKDKDHAFKIGVDKINEYIAKEKGIAL